MDPIVRSKEIKYRGRPIEALKAMDIRESAKFMPSRSRRTILRNPDVIEKFVKLCEQNISKGKKVRTHLRDIVIVPKMVGMNIAVYSGKAFEDVTIVADMIGHRLGEFVLTRAKVNHSAAGIGATRSSRAAKK